MSNTSAVWITMFSAMNNNKETKETVEQPKDVDVPVSNSEYVLGSILLVSVLITVVLIIRLLHKK